MIKVFCGIVVSFYITASFMNSTDGASWRYYPKAFKNCGSNMTIYATDLKVVYSDHGRKWIVKVVINVQEDSVTERFTFDVFKDGHPPMKVATWAINDMCNVISNDNKFINPIFETGEFPRTCSHKKGVYNVTRMDSINVTGQMTGGFAAFRGNVNIKMNTYDKQNKHTSCFETYGSTKIVN